MPQSELEKARNKRNFGTKSLWGKILDMLNPKKRKYEHAKETAQRNKKK